MDDYRVAWGGLPNLPERPYGEPVVTAAADGATAGDSKPGTADEDAVDVFQVQVSACLRLFSPTHFSHFTGRAAGYARTSFRQPLSNSTFWEILRAHQTGIAAGEWEAWWISVPPDGVSCIRMVVADPSDVADAMFSPSLAWTFRFLLCASFSTPTGDAAGAGGHSGQRVTKGRGRCMVGPRRVQPAGRCAGRWRLPAGVCRRVLLPGGVCRNCVWNL